MHCYLERVRMLERKYEECEKFEDLEYYQCAYNIYKLPKEQVEFFSRYDQITYMCKDCDNIKKENTEKAEYCNNHQLQVFKDYGQCLEDNTGKSEHEIDLMEACTILECKMEKGALEYAQCSYECHKDIVSKVVEFIGKPSIPTNTTESSTPSTAKSETQETGKSTESPKNSDLSPNSNSKNSSTSLYSQFSIYSVMLLIATLLQTL